MRKVIKNNEINNNISNNRIEINSRMEEVKCEICDQRINPSLMEDHIVLHQLQENEYNEEIKNETETLDQNYYNDVNINVMPYIPRGRGGRVRRNSNRIRVTDRQNDIESLENLSFSESLSSEDNGNGLDNDLISMLPESKLTKVDKLPSEKKSCTICLEEFKENVNVLTLPCYHIFHKECIKSWFKKDNKCAICKFEINKKNLEMKNLKGLNKKNSSRIKKRRSNS